jgi:hypothetical protein
MINIETSTEATNEAALEIKKTPGPLVRKRTVPIVRPPRVDEI